MQISQTSFKTFTNAFKLFLSALIMLGMVNTNLANAAEKSDKKHHLVIQVSTDDPRTQKIAMNNAVNLQKLYGVDNVEIEIVAYGPGLGMMTAKNEYSTRVKSLILQDITFSACANTMSKMKNKSGKIPVLSEGVETVTAGVARIMELQEQGYSYIRP
ncbi:MAG: intracellular sulfur oxidation DsrE/DsrF family protein [Cocleimonas sp.]|jgi:intracellular sulfur oxidation DsrE/DsrF family protein